MSSGVDVSQLSDSEKTALDTYTAVTGQEPSSAVPLLRRSEWNVQVGYGPPRRTKRAGLLIIATDRCIEVLRWGRTGPC